MPNATSPSPAAGFLLLLLHCLWSPVVRVPVLGAPPVSWQQAGMLHCMPTLQSAMLLMLKSMWCQPEDAQTSCAMQLSLKPSHTTWPCTSSNHESSTSSKNSISSPHNTLFLPALGCDPMAAQRSVGTAHYPTVAKQENWGFLAIITQCSKLQDLGTAWANNCISTYGSTLHDNCFTFFSLFVIWYHPYPVTMSFTTWWHPVRKSIYFGLP